MLCLLLKCLQIPRQLIPFIPKLSVLVPRCLQLGLERVPIGLKRLKCLNADSRVDVSFHRVEKKFRLIRWKGGRDPILKVLPRNVAPISCNVLLSRNDFAVFPAAGQQTLHDRIVNSPTPGLKAMDVGMLQYPFHNLLTLRQMLLQFRNGNTAPQRGRYRDPINGEIGLHCLTAIVFPCFLANTVLFSCACRYRRSFCFVGSIRQEGTVQRLVSSGIWRLRCTSNRCFCGWLHILGPNLDGSGLQLTESAFLDTVLELPDHLVGVEKQYVMKWPR